MQWTRVTTNSRWTLGKEFLPWGCWDITAGAKRGCVTSRDGDLLWTRLRATWSESALLWSWVLDQVPSRDLFQPKLGSAIQSKVIKCVFIGESSMLRRNALQYKTWPFGMKFYFCCVSNLSSTCSKIQLPCNVLPFSLLCLIIPGCCQTSVFLPNKYARWWVFEDWRDRRVVERFRIHSPKTEKSERNKQTPCAPALANHERAHSGTC